MTDMRTDFEASLIEHLDFAPPCEVRGDWFGILIECSKAAEWIVTSKHHCVEGQTKTKLMCENHLDQWMDPGVEQTCLECGDLTDVGPRIIRTERIGA